MINNQFSRRNLPTETRLALAYQFKEFEAEKAKSRQLANLKQFAEEANKGKTLEVIAKKAGGSMATAEQYDAIQRKGTEEQKTEVAEGKASIKKIYTQIRKAERLETNKVTEWPKGKYRVIYTDPPCRNITS